MRSLDYIFPVLQGLVTPNILTILAKYNNLYLNVDLKSTNFEVQITSVNFKGNFTEIAEKIETSKIK